VNLNATLLAQAIVFLIFAWFTMRFVWPPVMKALEERREKVKEGLEAAERSQKTLVASQAKIEHDLSEARAKAAQNVADAEKRAQAVASELKSNAEKEADRIIKDAKSQVNQEIIKAKESLRDQVAGLALKGAEQILKKEIDASSHADLLTRLKTEL
jgi:F-type H+-transporting ATPase subunit b